MKTMQSPNETNPPPTSPPLNPDDIPIPPLEIEPQNVNPDEARPENDILSKIRYSEPYRFFLSTIDAEPRTRDDMLSVSFQELLSEDLGVLESSLQINFIIDLNWLLDQYIVKKYEKKPLTLVFCHMDQQSSKRMREKECSNIDWWRELPMSFIGYPNARIMILSYVDQSIRVIVMTGNLVELDWLNTTLGIWISPRLPYLGSSDEECLFDSETNFKKDFLRYLQLYEKKIIEPWIQKVKSADFRQIKVIFINSAPGSHPMDVEPKFGLQRLMDVLLNHAVIPKESAEEWPLYCQISSAGFMNRDPESWFEGEFSKTMFADKQMCSVKPPLKLIYPTIENVLECHIGYDGGYCLPYDETAYESHPWLRPYFCKWKSEARNRTKAMPHLNTYCRLSPCKKYFSWFLLTSANLSKLAWGNKEDPPSTYRMLNYEAGVLFVPKILIQKDRIPLHNENPSEDGPQFVLPYDIPLTPYADDDAPWVLDFVNV